MGSRGKNGSVSTKPKTLCSHDEMATQVIGCLAVNATLARNKYS